MIHHGDCLEVMATMPADSVDAIVCDPPYDLLSASRNGSRRINNPDNPAGRFGKGFMGKTWDGTGIAFRVETWAEALRIAKPGAYLLAFGGTRTSHRLAVAIEDAGWIIRDTLVWCYASGFPKGRANLKPAWEPIVMARKPGPLRHLNIDECRIATTDDLNGGGYGGELRDPDATSYGLKRGIGDFVQPAGRWPSNVLLSDPELFDEPNPWVVGSGQVSGPGAFPGRTGGRSIFGLDNWDDPNGQRDTDAGGYSRFFIIPKADRADREPIVRGEPKLHMPTNFGPKNQGALSKQTPVKPSLRENSHPTVKPTDLMRHLVRLVTPVSVPCLVCQGCGGTVEYTHAVQRSNTKPPELQVRGMRDSVLLGSDGDAGPEGTVLQSDLLEPLGSADPTDDEGLVKDTEGLHRGVESEAPDGDEDGIHSPASPSDGRSAGAEPHGRRGSRSPERDQGRQPAGKPASPEQAGSRCPSEAAEEADQVPALPLDDPDFGTCELCAGRLAPGERRGRVLDPFLGSGTTAIACELEGFPWIGIEKEAEYVAIAEARLNGVQRGLGLDVPAPTKQRTSKPFEERSPREQARLAKSNKERDSSELFWMRRMPDEEPAA